jgi:hypothetical protein
MDDLWGFAKVLTTGDDSWEVLVEDQKRLSYAVIRLQGKSWAGMPSEVRCHFKQLERGKSLARQTCLSFYSGRENI